MLDGIQHTSPPSATAPYAEEHAGCGGVREHLLAQRRNSALVWPSDSTQGVAYSPLRPELKPSLGPVMESLFELAALGDALHRLQTPAGKFISHLAAEALSRRSAEIMLELSESECSSPEAAYVMGLRAEALCSGAPSWSAALAETDVMDEQDLTVLCGPLCTWRAKTRSALHSVVIATSNDRGSELMGELDNALDAGMHSVAGELDVGDLAVTTRYPMQALDLIVCGGEANCIPKHFAYFLPEDEGFARAPRNKSLLFVNAYAMRHAHMSRMLAARMLDGPTPSPQADVGMILLCWMRGHDLAHGITFDSRQLSPSGNFEHEPRMALSEAIADTFGFWLSVSPPWQSRLKATQTDVAAVFMAELLHYLRRGPWHWGDAAAAFLELSFLLDNRYLALSSSGLIQWNVESLLSGMRHLAETLASTMRGHATAQRAHELLSAHAWRGDSPAAQVLRTLRTNFGHVPTGLGYA